MAPSATGWRIVLTLWAGAVWTSGFVVAPMLFSVLDDRQLAGALAGEMFHAVGWLGLACLLLLLCFEALARGARMWRRWRARLVALALFVTAVAHFVVRPLMAGMEAEAAAHGTLHGLASALQLLLSVIALVLVAWQEPDAEDG